MFGVGTKTYEKRIVSWLDDTPDFFPVPIILANDLRASLRKLSSLDEEFLRKSKFLSHWSTCPFLLLFCNDSKPEKNLSFPAFTIELRFLRLKLCH